MPRPIPANLMPSTAQVWIPADGLFGGSFAEESVTIRNVRFDRYDDMLRLQYAEGDGYVGRMYVDAHTSIGAFAIPEGSLVQVDGSERMRAVRVHEYADFNGHVHHWEIELR